MRTIAIFALLAALLAVPARQAFAADYRFLSSWDLRHPSYYVLFEPFAKSVESASNGRIKLVFSGPETVPSFEQLQPAGSGAFQFLL